MGFTSCHCPGSGSIEGEGGGGGGGKLRNLWMENIPPNLPFPNAEL